MGSAVASGSALVSGSAGSSVTSDEAAAPATVTDEITAVEPEEAAAPGAEPDAEPKPETTAEGSVLASGVAVGRYQRQFQFKLSL